MTDRMTEAEFAELLIRRTNRNGTAERLCSVAHAEITALRAEVEKLKAARDLVLEEAARVAEPTPTKCVCVELAMDGVWFCDCGCTNSEDYAQAASWCERANIAIAIRALKSGNDS